MFGGVPCVVSNLHMQISQTGHGEGDLFLSYFCLFKTISADMNMQFV